MESPEEERRDTGQAQDGEGLGAGKFSLAPKVPPSEQSSQQRRKPPRKV